MEEDFKFPWEIDEEQEEEIQADAGEDSGEFDIDLPWSDEDDAEVDDPIKPSTGELAALRGAMATGAATETRYSEGWQIHSLAYILTETHKRLEEKNDLFFDDYNPLTLQYIQFLARTLPSVIDDLKELSRLQDLLKNCKFNAQAAHALSQQLTLRETAASLMEPICAGLIERIDRCGEYVRDGGGEDILKKILMDVTQSMERQIFTWSGFAAQTRCCFNSANKRNRAGIAELESALASSTGGRLNINKLSPFFALALARDIKDGEAWLLWRSREALALAAGLPMTPAQREEVRGLAARVEAITLLLRENIAYPEPRAQSLRGEIPVLIEQMFHLEDKLDLDPKKLLMSVFHQTGRIETIMDELAKDNKRTDPETSSLATETKNAVKALGQQAARSVSAYRTASSYSALDSAMRAI